ncbi:nucleotidyl transferase family protein [Carbonactinospora thermoautotrophica]|uniref:hypothetical protein n=2 Tax=Carbonactinospora thermoautotrophica TaxID=1469144 RepID=UPI000AB8A781|nr:hypothetical protein [Carbonactinospora thermoautotrophica]
MDTRTGELTEVRPSGSRLLRVLVRGPATPGPTHLEELRLLVLGDLVRRVVERQGLRVLAAWSTTAPGRPAEQPRHPARQDLAELNIPQMYAEDVAGVLDGVVDLELAGADAAPSDSVRVLVRVGRLLFAGREPGGAGLAEVAARGYDPLAVRLAFLEHRYGERLELTWETLGAADATLRRWRHGVAEWAEHPSRPASEAYVDEARAALDADLDTPGALAALRRLERDPDVPPGAKFETFALLDQVLALDLAREVGRPPGG